MNPLRKREQLRRRSLQLAINAQSLLKTTLRYIFTHKKLLLLVLIFTWAFITMESLFMFWLRWSLFGGAEEADRELTHGCPKRDYSLPLAVVVPLIARQVSRLQWSLDRWGKEEYYPCVNRTYIASEAAVSLIFYFDRPLTEADTAKAVAEVKKLVEGGAAAGAIRECFGAVLYRSADLSAAETKNSYGLDMYHNLMQTGGSNRQFEEAFRVMGGGQFRHMLFMEPDLWPIRAGWLEAVIGESKWGPFWMRGTVMRYTPKFNIGFEPFRTNYQRHLNGNSIYALDDGCFARYRELTRREFGDGAFDVAMTLFRLGVRRVKTFQAVAHRFENTVLMANLGVTRFSEGELAQRLPDTYLVHAKFMHVKYARLNFMQY